MNKAADILTKDAAILLYMVIGWAVPILRGGSFAALGREDNLTSLAVLLLVWLGLYLAHYIQSGDWTPPPPAERRIAWVDVTEMVRGFASTVTFHVAAADINKIASATAAAVEGAIGHAQPLPPSPPPAPPEA